MKQKLTIIVLFITICGYSQKNLQEILAPYKDSIKGFGIAALVQTKTFKEKESIGFDQNVANSNDQLFCIGSITKLYLSIITFQLLEEKKLSLNDSISMYGSVETNNLLSKKITILQLLTHSSGIKDVIDAKAGNNALMKPYEDFNNDLFYKSFDSKAFEPGAKNEYCNANYHILKNIIEEIEDKPLISILQERIFIPLGLKNTFPYYSANMKNLTKPFVSGQYLDEYPKLGINHLTEGIGNIVTNTEDLNTFLRAIYFSDKLINKNSRDMMIKILQPASADNKYFGVGCLKFKNDSYDLFGFSGRTISYSSMAYVDLKTETSYILLMNTLEFSKKKADNIIVSMVNKIKSKKLQ